MALIDVLPQFRLKPLDITPYNTKLKPKKGEAGYEEEPTATTEPAATSTTTAPTVAATTADGTAPLPPFNPAQPTTTPKTTYLTPKYAAYADVLAAFDKAGVKTREARAAIIGQLRQEGRIGKGVTDFNYGNIIKGKTWKGPTVVRNDTDAQGNPIKQEFRVYKSDDEYVNDYLDTLKRLYPKSYQQLMGDKFDINEFASGLIGDTWKYAEDPQYKEKISGLYNDVLSELYET